MKAEGLALRRTTVLASGNGSNFQAVVEAARAGEFPLDVHALVVNRADALVLQRAAHLNISPTLVVWERARESRVAYDARLLEAVERTAPELVLLLGWMHVLPPAFVSRFPELLNLHPAYLPIEPKAETVDMPDGTQLPAFRGPHAVEDALARGCHWIGASVHRVGNEVDRGTILAREALRIDPDEERPELEARLHAAERRVLGVALRRWAGARG
ncbi:MAG TPA: formyltransferase family protein [Solirubrobacteraceae bacterium]|nr:formyltransferase family protein [Solirubrobacteraceae bacterium]